MSKEKVIEIKINDVTYIVSEVNRNDDCLKEIINVLIEKNNEFFGVKKINNLMIKN